MEAVSCFVCKGSVPDLFTCTHCSQIAHELCDLQQSGNEGSFLVSHQICHLCSKKSGAISAVASEDTIDLASVEDDSEEEDAEEGSGDNKRKRDQVTITNIHIFLIFLFVFISSSAWNIQRGKKKAKNRTIRRRSEISTRVCGGSRGKRRRMYV